MSAAYLVRVRVRVGVGVRVGVKVRVGVRVRVEVGACSLPVSKGEDLNGSFKEEDPSEDHVE